MHERPGRPVYQGAHDEIDVVSVNVSPGIPFLRIWDEHFQILLIQYPASLDSLDDKFAIQFPAQAKKKENLVSVFIEMYVSAKKEVSLHSLNFTLFIPTAPLQSSLC